MSRLLRSLAAPRSLVAVLCLTPVLSQACVVYGSDLVDDDGGGSSVLVSAGRDGSSGSDDGGSGSGTSIPSSSGGAVSSPTGSRAGNTSTGNTAGTAPSGTGGESGATGTTGTGAAGTSGTTTGNAGQDTSPPQGGTGPLTPSGGSDPSGGAPAAGAGGNGGEGGVAVVVPEDDPVIDDMQDSNNRIKAAEGRNGYWFTFNDMSDTGTQVPEAGTTFVMATTCDPARTASTRCARSLVTGDFALYGAGMGFDFHSNKSAYDVSKYSGIEFWAKNDDTMTGDVTLAIATVATEAATDTPAFEFLLPLDATWTKYTVGFDELALSDWYSGDAIAWDAAEVLKVQFKTALSVTHDIYVDDIVFVE